MAHPEAIEEGSLRLPDGRALAWARWGDPAGRPLLWFHGTPGSRLSRPVDLETWRAARAHVVTFDRPGFGGSTPERGLSFRSSARDALALADALGWERFTAAGGSGGGPHALALAAAAPGRVRRVACIVGAGRPDRPGAEEGLLEYNRASLAATRRGREALEAFLDADVPELLADPVSALAADMADAPPADHAVLSDPGFAEVIAESLREALRQGHVGWSTDSWLLQRPWDFALAEVRVPVLLVNGAEDRNTPIGDAHDLLAGLPDAELMVLEGCGHLGWRARETEILERLLGSS